MELLPGCEREQVLIFDDQSGKQIDLDWRGSSEEVLARLYSGASVTPGHPAARGRGRPRLGVVSREITLLPRHWAWLNAQPGGASVALRKLVEDARRQNGMQDRVRQAQEACYGFITAMAGNLPGFEEAARALFAGRQDKFETVAASWPQDIGNHARQLAAAAFP
jgi:hypothetical protein